MDGPATGEAELSPKGTLARPWSGREEWPTLIEGGVGAREATGATGVRVVRAVGDPADRGRQLGRQLGDLIERSIGFYHRYIERRGIPSAELQDFLNPYLDAAEHHLPELAAMVKGMAEGAMVPVWELFAVNAFEELEALLEPRQDHLSFLKRDVGYSEPPDPQPFRRHLPERCSSFTVTGPGVTLMGHNEQWLAGDAGNVAVVIEVPTDGSPALASPTVVCCLASVGMNEFRGAQAIQSLMAADDGVGVPRVMVSRQSLEAADRVDAVRRARLAGRAGGYGHVFAFPGGDAFMVETTGQTGALLEGPGPHTNHYLHPDLASLAPEASPGSVSRYERMLTLIEERRPSTPDEVMEVLSDHASAPQAICLHPDEREGDEAATIVFSMVCDVEAGRMWVADGNPCTAPFEEIDLTGVTSPGT
jgi:isopenicillin-N N-acyltransferase-like protein